jgi:hypothetical protein
MKMDKNNKKIITFVALGLFVLTGTYNAVVINFESHLSSSDVKFVKRLDEIYGVTVKGREIASSGKWEKLGSSKVLPKIVTPIVAEVAQSKSIPSAVPEVMLPEAAIQNELSLSLVEVLNSKKWEKGLPASQFNGELSTNNGVIEKLSVSLPNGETVTASFSEMSGNVFEYDLNGDLYSGMMYQVDQKSYMVTLTTGPLEGTRLRFSSETEADKQQSQEILAQNNVEAGSFGKEPLESPEQMVEVDQNLQQEAVQAQGFNFNSQKSM